MEAVAARPVPIPAIITMRAVFAIDRDGVAIDRVHVVQL